ncbi:MAG: guanylate kinase [Bacillota bacterium]|nr:guanylate kinase [Bacillota bacterium]
MSNDKKGLIVVISGPSGVGKGTIIQRLKQIVDNCVFSVSATTRSPRPGEVNGKDYFFISKEDFEENIRNQKMLEYTMYNGNYYGTPEASAREAAAQGNIVLLDIEVEGAGNVKKIIPESVSIFIMPPSKSALEQRLIGRGTETVDQIRGRLNIANREMDLSENYDYIVTNDSIDRAAQEIRRIILKEQARLNRPY